MKVSVIIAAYNAEEFLVEAMESALNQSLKDYEVIVINDGSTDSTESILNDFMKDYSHLKVITKENGGPSAARNRGLLEAQGEFVYFMDADDILELGALEQMYNRAVSMKADLVIANYDIFSQDMVTKIKNLSDILRMDDVGKYNKSVLWTFSLWNKMFRKSIIDENALTFPPISYTEDGVFTMRFVYCSNKITGLNEVVYHYRRMTNGAGNAITATVDVSKIRQYIKAHEWIYEAAEKSIQKLSKEEQERIGAADYLSEIHRKEVQILLNQFYRRFWSLEDEAVALVIDEMRDKITGLTIGALSELISENPDTPLLNLSKDREEMLRISHFAVAVYGSTQEKIEFAQTLKSALSQSLVQMKFYVPDYMKNTVKKHELDYKNIIYLPCESKAAFYNMALADTTTEFMTFTEAGYTYPYSSFRWMFKYLRKSPSDFVAETIYQKNYGEPLPIYYNSIALNSVKSGVKNGNEMLLDYTLANKYFRVSYLKENHIVFGEDPRAVLPAMYDNAYWNFLNNKLVMFAGKDKDFLKTIASKETLAYIEKTFEDKPVDFKNKEMEYDSAKRYSKIRLYPLTESERWNTFRQNFIDWAYKQPVKDQTAFLSVRSDGKLEGNAAALYPYIKGKKVVCSKRLPHGKIAELKMIYYFITSKVIITDDYVRYARWLKLRKGQRMIQLWHACGAFKMFGQRGTNMSIMEDRATHAQYSLACVSGPGIRSIYADAFDIHISKVSSLGVPRTDVFFDEEYKENVRKNVYKKLPQLKGKEIILYAPTFRDAGGDRTRFHPDLDFEKLSANLKESQIFVICPHPIMTNDIVPKKYKNILVTRHVSTNDMMIVSDMLITDYSSVVFEYALLRKPIAFYCYDLRIYDRGFFLEYPDDLPGNVYQTQRALMKFINDPMGEYNSKKYDEFLENYMGACDGKSRERIAKIVNDYLGGQK